MKRAFRHLKSFIAPLVMGVIVPFLIVYFESRSFTRPVFASSPALRAAGALLCLAGSFAFVSTVRTFILIGDGTIMPWDPARKMIVAGPYRYVRNPMISSLILVMAGEALLFASRGIGVLAVLNYLINTVYFIYSEEPGLEKRFGAAYTEYKRNVPRWIPRLTPWTPDEPG